MRAAARKTELGYKPVIVHPTGRKEIIGTQWRLSADMRGYAHHRAAPAYPTREEAIAVAQQMIDARVAHQAAYMADYNARHGAAI